MRITRVALTIAAVTASTLAYMAPVQAGNIGNEGCTPGYWKNHTDNWYETETLKIRTNLLLNSDRVGYETSEQFADATLLDALSFKGGPGLLGAERNLLRAAAAAWLNAAHEGVGYPYRREVEPYSIVATVNEAIASGSRDQMLAVAAELDEANNLGCPLS